jgi:hypothetical protein
MPKLAPPTLFTAIALSLISPSLTAQARDADHCLKIGVSNGGVTGQASGELAVKIFERAQLCAKAIMVPQYRVSAMEEKGELDGDAWRVPAYFESHPFLVRVPTAVDYFRGNIYWRGGTAEPTGPDATIGILLGAFWAKQALSGSGVHIFEANSYDQMFRLTESGHIQGFVMPRFTYQKIAHPELDALGLTSREIYSAPIYLALNRRHESLLPQLDNAIRQLSAEGVISQMLSINDR